jgi:hypothetical protein
VIRGQAAVVTIENISLINAYRGIDLSAASTCCLRGIYGSPLKVGLTADRSFAVSRYDQIHFSPDYWAWSKLPNSPSQGGAHAAFMRQHGTAVHIREMDGFYFGFAEISGYKKGLHFERGASGDDASGELSYVSVTDCGTALHVDDAKGFLILGCKLEGSDFGIWGKDRTHYRAHTSTIAGGTNAIHLTNHSSVELVNSTVTGEVKVTGRRSKYANHRYDESLPPFKRDYERVRKPAKRDLFNVKDHGATGDGKADDTPAFKAAIAAAKQNGGGIVFVPDGEYRITRELDLGNGVELRGNSGGRHILGNKRHEELGSVLYVDTPPGDEDGTPFLTMGDGSGVRGVGFHYLQQDYKTFKPFPFMVWGKGSNNYVIDCSGSNPYQGVKLSGDKPLVEYSFIGGLKRTYFADGSRGGRIQNCHIKPDFWRTAWLPSSPKSNELEEFKWKVNAGGYKAIHLKDCDDFVVMSIFNHASHTLMTIDNSSGQTLMVGGEQLQGGYLLENGNKTFDFLSSKANVNHIGDRKGTFAMKSLPSFTGTARFYNCDASGTSDETWSAAGGHLFFQSSSITGPSNRGANSIYCGPEGRITAQSGGCGSHHLGVENKGAVVFDDFHFDKGVPRGAALAQAKNQPSTKNRDSSFAKATAGRPSTTYIVFDANQASPRGYGLELDMRNVRMDDALIIPNSGFAKGSLDGRRLSGARLATGNSYSLDVTDPAFQDGSIQDAEIILYFRIDTTCSIKTQYRTKTGMKLANTTEFKLKDKPFWKEYRFRVSDAHFDSKEDVRIDIDGASPLLAMVVVASPTAGK